MEMLWRRCGFPNGFEVGADGSKGGLYLAWKDEEKVTLKSFFVNFNDVMIADSKRKGEWYFIGFYGSLFEQQKRDSWNALRSLASNNVSTWLVCGDFNEILYTSEKKGGAL